MAEKIHSEQQGGIFIPYDKLLQQQSDKLDKILDELREMDKRKLDLPVFESFRVSYEQRHELLKDELRSVRTSLTDRPELIEEFHVAQKDISDLKKYKAEREAVQAQSRYFWSGGALVGLLVLVNVAVNAWQLLSHGTP